MVVLGGGAVSYERGAAVDLKPLTLVWIRSLGSVTRLVLCYLKVIQGYLAHEKSPPPWDFFSALDIVLL